MLKLIRNRAGLVLAGLIAALCPMLMAPSGGFPSYPFFQGVGIGVAAKGTTNKLWIENAGTVSAVVSNSTTTTGFAQVVVQTNNGVGGGAQALFCINAAANACSPNEAANHAVLLNSGPLHLLANSGSDVNDAIAIGVDGANAATRARIIANGTSNTALGILGFYDNAGTRFGYAGHASSGSGLVTYESDAGVQLAANNGVDGLSIDTSHNLAYNGVNINPAGGTFTLTVASGCTTTPTSTATWMKVGSIVTMHTGSGLTCTSNAAGFSASGLPASLQPASLITSVPLAVCTNNTVASSGNCYVTFNPSTGTLTFGLNGNTGGWTSSGTKAVVGNFTYSVQ